MHDSGKEETVSEEVGDYFLEIPVDSVVPNQFQPRRKFDESLLVSLANSIRESGVLQPIIVRPLLRSEVDGESYELIAGERRWRAARRVGLESIPAIIRSVGDLVSLQQAIVENLHRSDLNPIEEAESYKRLIDEFGFTHSQVASTVGKSRSSVANTLRLLQLSLKMQRLLTSGGLSAGHAKALLMIEDQEIRWNIAVRIIEEGLSVRSVEAEAQKLLLGSLSARNAVEKERSEAKNRGYLEVENSLSEYLNTSVQVEKSNKKGRLVVEFADDADLSRLYELLLRR